MPQADRSSDKVFTACSSCTRYISRDTSRFSILCIQSGTKPVSVWYFLHTASRSAPSSVSSSISLSALAPVNLKDLLVGTLGFLEPELQAKDISVDVDFPDLVPAISGDAGQLTQAFFNLLKNAMQAMPNGGKIKITCTVDDVFVHLRFADNGPGFTKEQLARFMEPYYTTKENGHGLGLLIVDRIVRSHGGDFAIDGKPGAGAAFTISLPRHARIIRQLAAPEK